MTDTAKRLVGPTQLSTASTMVYTVPASTQTIVRSIHVANPAGVLVNFNLTINAPATTVANSFYNLFPIPPNGALDWSGFLVLNAGDMLYAYANQTTSLVVVICGIEVTA